jgi:hypothetical protein
MKDPQGDPQPVRLTAALAALMITQEIARAEAHGDLPPGMAGLLRRMKMAPSEVGARARAERRRLNAQPHQGTREMERRRRQLAKKAKA